MIQREEHPPSEDVAAAEVIQVRTKVTDLSISCHTEREKDNAIASSDGSDCTASPLPPAASPDDSHLRLAMVLAAQGRHQEALQALAQELAANPTHVDALSLQGTCLAAMGNWAQAVAAFASALAANPSDVRSLLGYAGLLKDGGQLEEAIVLLERAQEEVASFLDGASDDENSPTSGSQQGTAATAELEALGAQVSHALAMSLTDLGTRLKLSGKNTWRERYDAALRACPSYAPAHYNLGVAAAEAGDAKVALQRYTKAVQLEPRYVEAWCNMGIIHKNEGRLSEAITAYERALAAAPTHELVVANLAAALTEQGTALKTGGDLAAGVKAYERAIALRPQHAEALYNLGVAYAEGGEVDKAVFMYQMAIAAAPQCAEAHNNLGVLHRERGNMEQALRCYEAALAVRPAFPQGLNNLAVMYTQQGRAEEAHNMLRAALMANPVYAEAHNNLGVLQRDVGDAAAAIESFEKCCELDPDNRNGGQNRLLALNYVHHGETELVCSAHAAWGQRFQQLHPPMPALTAADVDTTPGRRLVIGYISPDLYTHSVSYFAEAPITKFDPSRVHVIVYSVVPRPDEKTARLKAAVQAAGGTWRDVAALPELELAEMVRHDKVDILVELTGHTAHNRLCVMARRPAPVQVTWIGYANSTGLTAIDYRFTDEACDPSDTEQTFTEELMRLPGCFLCYTPAWDAPPVAPLPALRNGFLTFGSFNALAKQTPEVLSTWALLLRTLPGSRLVLKNKPFACPAVQQRYWTFFEEHGVTRDRVDLLPLAPATRDHLGQYSLMDVCLDPWPYAGTTTTAEALYMGVPCLTLVGKCHAHNVGASLMSIVGLGEGWVARSIEDYVAKAGELTADVGKLATLRAGLRERMLASPLCDAKRFMSELEDTYGRLWQRWVDDQTGGEHVQ